MLLTRKLVINYIEVPPYGGGDEDLTTQILLYETTNIIEIHTTSSPDYGSNKSMGIENLEGTIGFARPGRNNEHWTASNDYVAFIPEFCSDSTTIIDGIEISISEDTLDLCEGTSEIINIEGDAEFEWLEPYSDLFTMLADNMFNVSASLEPGIYPCVVEGTADNGCVDQDTVFVRISDCTNAIEGMISQPVSIFPNPAVESFYLNTISPVGHLFIHDLYGKLMHETTPVNNSVFISDLQPGIYVISFKIDETSYTIPFVKI